MGTSRFFTGLLVVACTAMLLACGGGTTPREGGTTPRLPSPEDKQISCDVLKQERRNGNFVLDVLVNEKESKKDVLRLAEWLREKNEGRQMLLSIFDSKDVFEFLEFGTSSDPRQQAEWDRKYGRPEKQREMDRKCKLHTLVEIGTEGKVVWMAEGRGH